MTEILYPLDTKLMQPVAMQILYPLDTRFIRLARLCPGDTKLLPLQ